MTNSLGNKIKQIRQLCGISQGDLAEKLGYLNQAQISKIENGNRKTTAQDLIEIAKVLGVTVEDIVANSKTA